MTEFEKRERQPTLRALAKILEGQFGRHVNLHSRLTHSEPIRVRDSNRIRSNIESDPHLFGIDRKFLVFSASCGSMARADFGLLRESAVILLVKSSYGMTFQVELTQSDDNWGISRVNSGATAHELVDAMQHLRGKMKKRQRFSNLRILRVPSMHVSALWLHHQKQHLADDFVPYTPNFAGLKVGRIYGFSRIQSLLKKRAIEMILHWYSKQEQKLS